jgi:hypothetical protein
VLGEVLLGGILVDGTLELLACQEESREVPQSCCPSAIEDTVDKIVLEAGCCDGSKMLLSQTGQEVSGLRRQIRQ